MSTGNRDWVAPRPSQEIPELDNPGYLDVCFPQELRNPLVLTLGVTGGIDASAPSWNRMARHAAKSCRSRLLTKSVLSIVAPGLPFHLLPDLSLSLTQRWN